MKESPNLLNVGAMMPPFAPKPCAWDYHVGRQRLRMAMRRRGLHALQPKAFTPGTTDLTHELPCAPGWLLDQPKPTQADRVWVSDITYLPLANGEWACLCAFQDLTSKQVIGARQLTGKRRNWARLGRGSSRQGAHRPQPGNSQRETTRLGMFLQLAS